MANEFRNYSDHDLIRLASSEFQVSKLDGEEMQDLIHELGKRYKDMVLWDRAWNERL